MVDTLVMTLPKADETANIQTDSTFAIFGWLHRVRYSLTKCGEYAPFVSPPRQPLLFAGFSSGHRDRRMKLPELVLTDMAFRARMNATIRVGSSLQFTSSAKTA